VPARTPSSDAADHAGPWSRLNHLQLGRFAEYYVTMRFVRAGVDVYTPAVDDRGIDLVARVAPGRYLEVQVKGARGLNYVFARKRSFPLEQQRFLAYVRFTDDEEPTVYLIPASAWFAPSRLFVSRDYEGKKSEPEYGLQVSKTTLPELEAYRFETILPQVLRSAS
jgi:hypothetical protein